MSDKKFVKSIMPTAIGMLQEYTDAESMYVIYAMDGHFREYIVGHSYISEEDAWKQVAETFRQKMLSQLEAA
jgi:hypothetical protein